MNIEDWKRVDEILDALIDSDGGRTSAQNTRQIAAACGDRPDLIPIVTDMLAENTGDQDFLAASASLASPNTPTEVAAPIFEVGATVGSWKIERVIGRGGMGEVYLAQRDDGQYRQQAALKVLASTDKGHAARFLYERQLLADLDHPGLAKLLDGGVDTQGRPYMAMEYIEGEQLLDYCRKNKPSLRQRLDLFISLCDVVSYAHQRLVVHRDIKPGNVLVMADGTPRLLDFGIATLAREAIGDGALTQALVTPNYAAPEQLTGRGVTTATDIHALGALLHALLTNAPPWDLNTVPLPVAIQRVLQQDPPKPSELAARAAQPAVPPRLLRGDLDAICARAMRKRPQDRYASASGLANDVRRYLCGEAVVAREGNAAYRVKRFMRRNWVGASIGGLFAVVIVGALVVTTWYANKAATERDIARRDSARVETLRSATAQLLQSAIALNESETGANGSDPDAPNLFVRAADELRSKHADTPQLTATTDHILGQLFFAKDDMSNSGPLLKRAAEYSVDEVDPDLLAEAQYDYAQWLYFSGDLDASRPYTERAVAYWEQNPNRYRAELIWSSSMRARYLNAAGDAEAAYALLQAAAAAADDHWGRNHPETATVYNTLGFQASNDNKIQASLEHYLTARAIWEALERSSSPEALSTIVNVALLSIDNGEHLAAEQPLRQAAELSESLYGDSLVLAYILVRHADLLSQMADPGLREEAVRIAARVVAMTKTANNPTHSLTIYNQCATAVIEIRTRPAEHRPAAFERIREAVQVSGSSNSVNEQRTKCSLALANVLIDIGDDAGAAAAVSSTQRYIDASGRKGQRYTALLAQVRARLIIDKQPAQAAAILKSAEAELLRLYRDDHIQVEMVRADHGLAMAHEGRIAAGKALAQTAVASIERQFGRNHGLTVDARNRLEQIEELQARPAGA